MPQTAGMPSLAASRASSAARVAVPAGSERRAADEHVGALVVQPAQQVGEGSILVLAELVVAAGERERDRQAELLEPLSGPDRALDPDRRRACRLLAAEAGEELVQVVDRTHAATARRSRSPIWQVAPR